jgi:hypothetical protein
LYDFKKGVVRMESKNLESIYYNVDRANAYLICEIIRIQEEREKRGNELCAKAVDMEKFLQKIQNYLHEAVDELLQLKNE